MPGGFCRISDQLDARAVVDGRGRALRRCLGDRRQAGAERHAAAGHRHRADPPHRRASAEPRRRQPVLARPLSRARRGDPAPGPRARRAGCATPKGAAGSAQPASGSSACWSPGARSTQDARVAACKVAAEALHDEERLGSALSLRARRAAHRGIPARAPVARCLAGHHRDDRDASPQEVEDDDGVAERAEQALQRARGFAGLAQENMNRAAGWRFLDMGRRIERAINTCRFGAPFADDEPATTISTCCSTSSTARSPIARATCVGVAAGAGARHGDARPL